MTKFEIAVLGCFALISMTACSGESAPPSEPAAASQSDFTGWVGTYEIVAVRRASDVAAPAMSLNQDDDPRGATITITPVGLELDGMACDKWTAEQDVGPNPIETDPILSDLYLPSLDGADPLLRPTLKVMCEGEVAVRIFAADHRVIAVPWQNSSHYLVAEKPLNDTQILRLQNVLTDMKFGDLEPTGILDAETLQAMRSYYEYRLDNKDSYTFARPAISESLLEKLQVFDE